MSEKGMEHYRENIDLDELHRNWKYRLRLDEYFKYRKSNGVVRDFYEIAYLALKERMEKGDMDMKNPYRLTSFDFANFSEICERLEINNPLQHKLLHSSTVPSVSFQAPPHTGASAAWMVSAPLVPPTLPVPALL